MRGGDNMVRSGEVGEKRCVAVFWISCRGWKEREHRGGHSAAGLELY